MDGDLARVCRLNGREFAVTITRWFKCVDGYFTYGLIVVAEVNRSSRTQSTEKEALMGAISGDLVQARRSDRDAGIVEGVLHLRYVPDLDYVQVRVATDEGDFSVAPNSVEVIRRGVVSPLLLDQNDPLFDWPGWHAVHDLEQAMADGLVPEERKRQGGTWQNLTNRLQSLTQPLVEAGWQRGESYREDSWEYGDSVACSFRRDETEIEVEYFENGTFDVYLVIENSEVDDAEPALPLFSAENEAELWAAFTERGWLS